MTEKEKYFARIKDAQASGLKNVKLYAAKTFGVSEEDAYAELNRLHDALDHEDVQVLGKYSPK